MCPLLSNNWWGHGRIQFTHWNQQTYLLCNSPRHVRPQTGRHHLLRTAIRKTSPLRLRYHELYYRHMLKHFLQDHLCDLCWKLWHKVFSKDNPLNIINGVKYYYEVTINWECKLYCGLKLNYNYRDIYVDITIENYVQHALTKFNHTPPDRLQHATHSCNTPIHGRKNFQLPTSVYQPPPLDIKVTHQIQSIAGTFLYYSKVNTCMKPSINEISSKQSAPTKDINDKATILIDYMSTYLDGIIWYHAIEMLLISKNDAAYLVLLKSHSCAAT